MVTSIEYREVEGVVKFASQLAHNRAGVANEGATEVVVMLPHRQLWVDPK
jgi:hypothetical protein